MNKSNRARSQTDNSMAHRQCDRQIRELNQPSNTTQSVSQSNKQFNHSKQTTQSVKRQLNQSNKQLIDQARSRNKLNQREQNSRLSK